MSMRRAAVAAVVTMMFGGAAHAANFVSNPGFEAPTTGATSSFFFADGGASAAPGWTLYNNQTATTSSEILASTAPNGQAQMLHITTGGSSNGVYQLLSGVARYASVNVKVLSGTVALYLYANSGTQQMGSAFASSPGWQTLSLDTGGANSNEIVIYSYGGGADFYVDNAYASDVTQPSGGGVPEPASWALMIAGFGAAGGAFRRRRALAA